MIRQRKFHLLILVALIFSLLVNSCSKTSWKKLESEEIEVILPELIFLQTYLNERNVADSTRLVTYFAFFDKYGITQTDWDSTMYWYAKNDISLYLNIYYKTGKKLEAKKDKLKKRVKYLDSVENHRTLWESKHLANTNFIVDNHCPMILAGRSYFELKNHFIPQGLYTNSDTLQYSLSVYGLSEKQEDSLLMKLAFYYQDVLQDEAQTTIKKDGSYTLEVKPYSKEIDSVAGSIEAYLPYNPLRNYLIIDSINLSVKTFEQKNIELEASDDFLTY